MATYQLSYLRTELLFMDLPVIHLSTWYTDESLFYQSNPDSRHGGLFSRKKLRTDQSSLNYEPGSSREEKKIQIRPSTERLDADKKGRKLLMPGTELGQGLLKRKILYSATI